MVTDNQVLDAIRNRRSIRKYKTEPVTRNQLITVVDAGRLAPSALNKQLWSFTVVTERETLNEMARLTPNNGPFLKGAPAAIVVSGNADHRSVYLDGAAAVENMLLAAHCLGLGSCWIQGYEKEYSRPILDLLAAPSDQVLVAIVSLGIPRETPVNSPRKRPLEEVLHWEKF